jgi:hypothetical protein
VLSIQPGLNLETAFAKNHGTILKYSFDRQIVDTAILVDGKCIVYMVDVHRPPTSFAAISKIQDAPLPQQLTFPFDINN